MSSIREQAAASWNEAHLSLGKGMMLEANTPRQLARLALQYPSLMLEKRGDGHPVIVSPGYSASEVSTTAIRRYLEQLDYRVHDWGLGQNDGNVQAQLEQLLPKLEQIHRRGGERVSLIGWSMGGVLSREIARQRPDLIRRVITMGSPITGGPKHTVFADDLRRRGLDLERMERELRQQQQSRPQLKVPTTAIFSRRDGVVAWPACIDQDNAIVEHVEVQSSHVGLVFDPKVYRIVADRLARTDIKSGS